MPTSEWGLPCILKAKERGKKKKKREGGKEKGPAYGNQKQIRCQGPVYGAVWTRIE